MKNSRGDARTSEATGSVRRKFSATALASALLIGGAAIAMPTAAFAVGSTANSISVGSAPSAGSVRGSYTPSASATSGDKVAVTLDKTSTGCSVSSGKLTFTGAGTCVVDFNDAGNATYAAASQVSQSIKVYSSNVITVSASPHAGSVRGSYTPSASATSGDKVAVTLDKTSTGCSVSSGKLTFTGAGTCVVDFNDAGNATYAAASQVSQSIKVYSSNVITVSASPHAGSAGGSYSPGASATSGDGVTRTLSSSSTGCAIAKDVVTFTGNGMCRVDFNDAGNGAFAVASQVQQVITVGNGGPQPQATLSLTSVTGRTGGRLTLTSVGGSGTGAITYEVTNKGSAGCSIKSGVLSSVRSGTCTVTVVKAADATFASAHSSATTVTLSAHPPNSPRAIRMGSAVWTGRSVRTTIVGSNFYGQPRVLSSVAGTRVSVSTDSGRVLEITVSVAASAPRGVHTFTLIFAHGDRTSLRYNQR